MSIFPPDAEPEGVHSLHCRPQSSTSIACSWGPPEADYDSYTIECLHQDSHTLVYSRRTNRDSSSYIITQLEPHKRYTISVKVISDGTTSEEAEDSVVTMIDRKTMRVEVIVYQLKRWVEVNFLSWSLQVLLCPPSVPGSVRSLRWPPSPPSHSGLTAAGSVTSTEP